VVQIRIERAQHLFIDELVAVVVASVAALGLVRVHAGVEVVAVRPAAVAVAAAHVGVVVHVLVTEAEGAGVAVLVVVREVARLDVARKAVGVGVVAVVAATRHVAVTVEVRVHTRALASPDALDAHPTRTRCRASRAGHRYADLHPVAEHAIVAVGGRAARAARITRRARGRIAPTAEDDQTQHQGRQEST
jgi:hypothetical protein